MNVLFGNDHVLPPTNPVIVTDEPDVFRILYEHPVFIRYAEEQQVITILVMSVTVTLSPSYTHRIDGAWPF